MFGAWAISKLLSATEYPSNGCGVCFRKDRAEKCTENERHKGTVLLWAGKRVRRTTRPSWSAKGTHRSEGGACASMREPNIPSASSIRNVPTSPPLVVCGLVDQQTLIPCAKNPVKNFWHCPGFPSYMTGSFSFEEYGVRSTVLWVPSQVRHIGLFPRTPVVISATDLHLLSCTSKKNRFGVIPKSHGTMIEIVVLYIISHRIWHINWVGCVSVANRAVIISSYQPLLQIQTYSHGSVCIEVPAIVTEAHHH